LYKAAIVVIGLLCTVTLTKLYSCSGFTMIWCREAQKLRKIIIE